MKRSSRRIAATLAFAGCVATIAATSGHAGPGGLIAFYGNDGTFLMRPDGSAKRLVGRWGWPDWSPDGRRLAVSGPAKGEDTLSIYVVTVATGRAVQLTKPNVDEMAAWSPDGRRIAFSRETGYGEYVYVMDADGGNLRKLTASSDYDVGPTWTRDGKWIAFSRVQGSKDGTVGRLWLMRPDGSGKRIFMKGGAWIDGGAVWSPDGARLAFWSSRFAGRPEVFVARPDGSRAKRVTNTPRGASFEPSWSPDGKRLVFARLGTAKPGIYAMSADGSDLRRLTNGNGRQHWPKWRR